MYLLQQQYEMPKKQNIATGNKYIAKEWEGIAGIYIEGIYIELRNKILPWYTTIFQNKIIFEFILVFCAI